MMMVGRKAVCLGQRKDLYLDGMMDQWKADCLAQRKGSHWDQWMAEKRAGYLV